MNNSSHSKEKRTKSLGERMNKTSKINNNKMEVISLALGVALVCAGVFVAAGNKANNSFKISLGFIMGLIWGIIASYIIQNSANYKDITIFFTLFVFGGGAVVISSTILKKYVYLPAWLSGWAITLGILGDNHISEWGMLIISIGISMIIGVFYVGGGVLRFQQFILRNH